MKKENRSCTDDTIPTKVEDIFLQKKWLFLENTFYGWLKNHKKKETVTNYCGKKEMKIIKQTKFWEVSFWFE